MNIIDWIKKNPAPTAVAAGVALLGGWFLFGRKKEESSGATAKQVGPSTATSEIPPPAAVPGRWLPEKGGRIVIATQVSFKPVVDQVAEALPFHEVFGLYHDDNAPLVDLAQVYPRAPESNVFLLLDGWSDPVVETAALAAQGMLLKPAAAIMRVVFMPPVFDEQKAKQEAWFSTMKPCQQGQPCFGRVDLNLPASIDEEDTPEATMRVVYRQMGQNIAARIVDGTVLL
jgi:hypothetical protein